MNPKRIAPVTTPMGWFVIWGVLALVLGVGFAFTAPLPQNAGYHEFADQRSLLGVPHFWNVVSNAVLLLAGLRYIRAKQLKAHILCMVGALTVSSVFLVSYLIYHASVGSVHFLGTGWIRPMYFTLLISHTILAVVILPLIGRTLYLAGHHRDAEHAAIARWTFPLWFYVNITGIVVYWMLYRSPWAS